MKQTILITVFHPFVTKNILNTDAFKILSSEKNLNIVLLVPEVKKDFFIRLYEKENVLVRGFPNERLINCSRVKFFSKISHLMIKSNYATYKRRERLDQNRSVKGYIKFFLGALANEVLSNLVITHLILRRYLLKDSQKEIRDVFDKHNPDLVFSTDAFDESDSLFQVEARRRGLRLISMVRSWDNCFSKGLMRVIPDKLIVNNQTIKEEAVSLHRIPAENIVVLGSAQYDIFTNGKRTERKIFFESMGLDPNKKLILFAPAGKILSGTDGQIIEILKSAIDESEFQLPVQFLIRNHPNHPADISSVIGRDDFVVEDPGTTFNRNNPKDTELTLSDNEHLADELFYADIVIWVATTLGMDAIVFDKPQIAIDFDGYEKKTYYKSVRRYHDEDHMKKMIALGGVSIAMSKDDLIAAINKYLKDPLADKNGREKVREQQFYKLDGGAGRRIGEFLLKEINQ